MANISSKADAPDKETVDALIDIINRIAPKYGVPSDVVAGLVWQESKFDPTSYRWNYDNSRDRSFGLMHINLEVAQWITGRPELDYPHLLDPETNIHIGCLYLQYLMRRFDNNMNDVLVAYNMGEGTMRKMKTAYGNNRYLKQGLSYLTGVQKGIRMAGI